MADNDAGSQAEQQAPAPNPALRQPAKLVGMWQTTYKRVVLEGG